MALNSKIDVFDLDLTPGGAPSILHCSQGDVGRKFKANLFWDGESFAPGSGVTCELRGKKPDNTVFQYSETIASSTVSFETTEQMTIVSGPVKCELVFTENSVVIATANFLLIVEETTFDPNAPSESEIPGLLDLIEETIGGDVRDEVQAELEAHPEWTTTVQDGAVTTPKLADEAVTSAKVNADFLKTIENAYVTPEQFGAVGDGTTDDTAAIQAAVDKQGLVIFGAKKSYRVTSVVRLKSNTTLNLNGCTITSESAHLFYNFLSTDAFLGYNGNGNIYIYNGRIIGGSISFIHANNVLVEKVDFSNTLNNHFFEICACKNYTIKNCSMVGMRTATGGTFEYVNIDNCVYSNFPWFAENSPTYDSTPNKSVLVQGNYLEIGTGDYASLLCGMGVHSVIGSEPFHENIVFDNNIIIGATDRGFSLSHCKFSRATNNYIEATDRLCWVGGEGNTIANNTAKLTTSNSKYPVIINEPVTGLSYFGNSIRWPNRTAQPLQSWTYFGYSETNVEACSFARLQPSIVCISPNTQGGTTEATVALNVSYRSFNRMEISTGQVGTGGYRTYVIRAYGEQCFRNNESYKYGDSLEKTITFGTDGKSITTDGYVRYIWASLE